MPRKLKTFITNLGFFELALAAPSMKAALEAWGLNHNAFQHGFAKETGDPKIIAATMAKPGVVLRRPVGTKGPFTEHAALPTTLWMKDAPKSAPKPKAKSNKKPETKSKSVKSKKSDKAEKAAILSFEKAKQKREAERESAHAKEAAQQEKDHARIEHALAKAEEEFERAKAHHDAAMADIEKERDKLDRRAKIERERWQKVRHELEEARERALK